MGNGYLSKLGETLGFGADHGTFQPAAHDNKSQMRLNDYASDPSQQYADMMKANPYLQQLLGQGGAMSDAAQQAKDIQNQGFSLTPGDRTAYGQASDDIARQFGQTEGSLANSLSSRGFGGGNSGIAGAAFSGLQGNKNEMLAKAQQGIAQARMNFAQKSLSDTRNFMNQAAGVGQESMRDQSNMLAQGANAYDNSWKTANDAYYNAFTNNQANTNPTFGEVFGSGVGGGVKKAGGDMVNTFNPFTAKEDSKALGQSAASSLGSTAKAGAVV